jgi:outer membrane lipoprotein SlyB
MKKSFLFLALTAAIMLTGCATQYYYEGHFATSNTIVKVGEAPVPEDVNAATTGIQEAAKNGGITRIATVDIRRASDGNDVYIVSGE